MKAKYIAPEIEKIQFDSFQLMSGSGMPNQDQDEDGLRAKSFFDDRLSIDFDDSEDDTPSYDAWNSWDE